MVMIIIKKINKNIFSLFLVFLISCSSQNSKNNIIDDKCKLIKDNSLSRVSFSDNESELSNLELNQFYNANNNFDIIFYNHEEGSINYNLKRFFKNEQNEWIKVTIINGKRIQTILNFSESEIIDSLNKLETNGYFQYCGICFDCQYYTFLIKSNQAYFKYYSSKLTFSGISDAEKVELSNYINIFNYFFDK